jgi:hypothetical protein
MILSSFHITVGNLREILFLKTKIVLNFKIHHILMRKGPVFSVTHLFFPNQFLSAPFCFMDQKLELSQGRISGAR